MVVCFFNRKIILIVDVMPVTEWYDKTNQIDIHHSQIVKREDNSYENHDHYRQQPKIRD